MNIQETTKFRVITPNEGCKLTTYKEGDDILGYESCIQVYQPLSADASEFSDISIEEDERLQELKREAEQSLTEE